MKKNTNRKHYDDVGHQLQQQVKTSFDSYFILVKYLALTGFVREGALLEQLSTSAISHVITTIHSLTVVRNHSG